MNLNFCVIQTIKVVGDMIEKYNIYFQPSQLLNK